MRYLRPRRAIRWIGTALCAGMILIAIGNLYWLSIDLIRASGEDWSVEFDFAGGSIGVLSKSGGGSILRRLSNHFHSWDQRAGYWRDLAIVPTYWAQQQPVSLASLTIPLWIPFVTIGVPTACLWWTDRTRRSISSFSRSRSRLALAWISFALAALILTVGFWRFGTAWSFADQEFTLGAKRGSFYAISRQAITPRTLWSIVIPSWLPASLLAVAALYAWCGSRRPKPGVCLCCHYDLTGNISGTCPECGAATERAR